METFLVAKIILFLAGTIFVFFWLYVGEINYHMWFDGGPLAQRGYEPITDNIFKCACLFLFVCTIIFNFNVPVGLLMVSMMVIIITFVLRGLFGWMS